MFFYMFCVFWANRGEGEASAKRESRARRRSFALASVCLKDAKYIPVLQGIPNESLPCINSD